MNLVAVGVGAAIVFAAPAAAQPQGPPAPVFAWPPSVFATADPGPDPKPTGLAVGHLVGWDSEGGLPGPSDNVWKDVVVVNRARKTLAIFANTGDWFGEFIVPLVRLPQTISLDFGDPYDVRVADMDQDGDQDIIVSNMGEPPQVAIILNNNDGSFASAQFVNMSFASNPGIAQVVGLAVGNFNGQGGPDVAITGAGGGGLVVELMLDYDAMAGVFSTHQEFNPPPAMFSLSTIAASRFRSTTPVGFVDLVVGSLDSSDLFVMRNNADGTWSTLHDPLAGGKTWSIAPAWFHTGVARDIVFGRDSAPQRAMPSFNDGNGDFTPQAGQDFSVFTNPYGAAAGKLNADNTVDVAIACTSGTGNFPPGSLFQLPGPVTAIDGGVAVFMYNAASETLGAPLLIDIDPGNSPKPCFLKITDMNRDGRKDIVTACTDSGNLSVLMNGLPPEKEDGDG